jgi:hypothetical protein
MTIYHFLVAILPLVLVALLPVIIRRFPLASSHNSRLHPGE